MYETLWWNHIIKANKFVQDIVDGATEGRNILLSLPRNVPWRDTLLELVEEKLRLNISKRFEKIKCPDEAVGQYLLEQYCRRETRATYRPGKTYAQFLAECEDSVLDDRCLWIDYISAEQCKEWIQFIVDYDRHIKDKSPAIFILEVHDENFVSSIKKEKMVEKIIFDKDITEYDKFAFCALAASAASAHSCKEYMRPYLAQLVSNICSEDIELCARCVEAGVNFLDNPIEVIREIIEHESRSDGEYYKLSKSEEEIQHLIWEAQLKTVFPLIEKYRHHFIKKYYQSLSNALPLENNYHEKIEYPEDIEIGLLLYMAANRKIEIDSREHAELSMFRDARNKLAHFNTLDKKVVDCIIGKTMSL